LIYDEVSGGVQEETRISGWMKTQELGSGRFSLEDYNFETPTTNLLASKDILPDTTVGKITHKLRVAGNDQFEIYDYPGGYEKRPQGDIIATHSMQQLEMAQFTIRGESNSYHLIPGYRFALARHPNAEGPYVITAISHTASEGGFHSGENRDESHYANAFNAMPYSLTYRPRPIASKPHVRGCQTAVVLGGPSGEEIYTDKYGRVMVRFHWVREGQGNKTNSCWIRFATQWAGRGWGTIHIPRAGQEVLVDFLEGDPDRPIIVGSVYNAANMPPFPLPAEKTKSGIKSESSKGGGGFNQIVFEDLKGSEDIIVHAQKDMNVTVENDRHTTILKNETAKISKNRSAEVGEDYDTKVGKKRSINAGDEILLETGAAKIVMKKSGQIEISGTSITISASASLTNKGGTINSEANATHTIRGALVTIN
jgi:type VI secretion system secreted protein VgrG